MLHASMGFRRCVHFTVSCGIFPLPQKPLVLHRAPLSPHPKPKANTDFLTASLVLPFPERPMVAVVQYVAFQIGSFTWQHAFMFPPCLFIAESYSPAWMGPSVFIQSPIYLHLVCFQDARALFFF